MKTLRYQRGHPHYVTMTVGELRETLARYPADMPVLAEWESIYTPFSADCASVQRVTHVHPEDQCDALILWVDQQ